MSKPITAKDIEILRHTHWPVEQAPLTNRLLDEVERLNSERERFDGALVKALTLPGWATLAGELVKAYATSRTMRDGVKAVYGRIQDMLVLELVHARAALAGDDDGQEETPVAAKHRVLITGSRAWTDEQMIRDAIAANVRLYGPENLVIVHGACPSGADAMADRIASAWGGGLTVERHPADWDHCVPTCHPEHRKVKQPGDIDHPGQLNTYCPGAGPRRNRHMVSLGADLCLAFIVKGSRGAVHTANAAERAGIITYCYEVEA